ERRERGTRRGGKVRTHAFRMPQARGLRRDGGLCDDRGRTDIARELSGECGIARDEDDRYAESSCVGRIHFALARLYATDPQTFHDPGPGMREETTRRAGAGMIAEEDGAVEARIQAFHHAVRLDGA